MTTQTGPDNPFKPKPQRDPAFIQALDRMKNLIALLAALLIGASVSGCGEICSNEPVATIPSPSGKAKAVVFHRKCGATTDPNTQVAVIPAYGTLANIPGNTLIVGGDASLEVRWVSDSSLSISGLGTAQVFKQEKSVAGVSVAYGP
jgi:hypothetical protein